MATLHRPKSAFELLLEDCVAEDSDATLATCVERALFAMSERVAGIPEAPLPQVDHAQEPEEDDARFLIGCLLQASALREMFSGFMPSLLHTFGNAENFDPDELLQEDEYGDMQMRKPRLSVWAEVDEAGCLGVFWDADQDGFDYLEEPLASVEGEAGHQMLELPPQLWQPGLPQEASPVQKQLASIVPATALNCLHNLLECLDAVCDLNIEEWPVLGPEGLEMLAQEQRLLMHLVGEFQQARHTVHIAETAARAALAQSGIKGEPALQEARKAAKQGKKAFSQWLSSLTGKPPNTADAQRLSRYTQHVEEGHRLVRAFYTVARRVGVSRAQLDAALSARGD